MASEIKALVFDYFGVVTSETLVDRLFSTSGVVRKMIDDVSLGVKGWQSFVNELSEELGINPEQLLSQYYETQINPLIVGLIRELKTEYEIDLLTNANSGFIEPFLIKHHLAGLFDVKIISSDIGILKPDLRIFQHLIRKIDHRPEEIVFIDDSSGNVAAAGSLGIKAIQFFDYEQLVTQLKTLGVIHA